MNVRPKKLHFFILAIIILADFCFSGNLVEAKEVEELTEEEISQYVKLSKTDRINIIQSIPQALTKEWIDLVVSASDSENQAIVLILREAVRSKVRDYLLVEGPKEVGLEMLKLGYKLFRMSAISDLSALIKEVEKMTIKESVKYLGQWLIENKAKIGTGEINFSYKDADKIRKEHKIQYIILFEPESQDKGRAIVRIYSNDHLKFPFSQGSVGGMVGVGWGEILGEKIPPFILTLEGDINREQIGYWQNQFMHQYSWVRQPDISIEFPEKVPEFDFKPKGFFERMGDKIKGFFKQIGKFFGFAAVVEPPEIEVKTLSGEPGLLAEIKGLFEDIVEQLKIIGDRLSEAQQARLEEQIKKAEQEKEPQNLAEKLKNIENELDDLLQQIEQAEQAEQAEQQEDKDKQEPDTEDAETEDSQDIVEKSPGASIIINEVAAGFDKAENEFIELYNASTSPLDLKDYLNLKLVSSSDEATNKNLNWLNTEIPGQGYFLLVGGKLALEGVELEPDVEYSWQLTSVSGVIIEDKEGNILDKVAWGKSDKTPPSSAVEGQGKVLEKGLLTGQSLQRENFIDTDNNEEDFTLTDEPNPTNSKGESLELKTEQDSSQDTGQESENEESQTDYSGRGGPAPSPVSYCSQDNLAEARQTPVIFNEIAWMGTEESYNNEWIELKNISTSTVYLENWQILDEAEQIKVVFGQNDLLEPDKFYLLERTDNEAVPIVEADKIYTGSLANSDESLRLFDSNCQLIDEIIATSSWPAGDNEEKRTMERGKDLSWHTYIGDCQNGICGTPRQENSQVSDNEDSGQNENSGQNNNLLITETRQSESWEFVEIYNAGDEQVDLANHWFGYFSKSRDWNEPFLSKQFPTSTIAGQSYYLIGLGDYPAPGEPAPDWQPYISHLSDSNGAVAIFRANPKNASTSQEAEALKIDALGWGEPIVKEGQAATSAPTGKSLARRIEPDVNGRLTYIDTDNNQEDFAGQTSTPGEMNLHNYSDLDNDGIIDGYDATTTISGTTTLAAGVYEFNNLEIVGKGYLDLLSDPNLPDFKGVKIIAQNLKIEPEATISADTNGYEDKMDIVRNYAEPKTLGSAGEDIYLPPGSSCAGTRQGGDGGGAIVLEIAGTLRIEGRISANGQPGLDQGNFCPASDAGNGGSIYIRAGIIKGSGIIESNGGNSYVTGIGGAGGQIALYYGQNQFTGDITAFGGLNNDGRAYNTGEAGTIYLSNSQSNQNKLIIKNQNIQGKFVLDQELTGLDELEFATTSIDKFATSTTIEAGELLISNSQFINGPKKILNFVVANDFNIVNSKIESNLDIKAKNLFLDSNSTTSADALGYQTNDEGPGRGGTEYIGASYGGVGGRNSTSSLYGSSTKPVDFGSGAKAFSPSGIVDGAGGGKIFIEVTNNFQLDGGVSANGEHGRKNAPATGGGSGGSIYIIANKLLGNGTIYAKGGGAYSPAGAGGGGRIAIYGNREDFSDDNIKAQGGTHSENPAYAGGDGTVYFGP